MAVLCDKCVGENVLEQHTIGFVIGPCEICGCVSCSRGSYRISESKFKQLKDMQMDSEKDLEIKKLKQFKPFEEQTLSEKLRIRAQIRRNATNRKSVAENAPDRLSDLLEEAANRIDELELLINKNLPN